MLALAQVEEMGILSGCVGWQLEAVRSTEGNAAELCLRLGPLFRLRLTLPGPRTAQKVAQARLELTTPGWLGLLLPLFYIGVECM